MVNANLREISRSFFRESSHLRIFVRGVNARKELFFLGWSVYIWRKDLRDDWINPTDQFYINKDIAIIIIMQWSSFLPN